MIQYIFSQFERDKVLINQTDGLQAQDYKFFGGLALIVIYVCFFFQPEHLHYVMVITQKVRAYISNFSARLSYAIDNFGTGEL